MIKKTLNISLFAVLFMLAIAVQAQKYGHLNYGNLLTELPQVTSADNQLKSFQEPLLAEVQSKYTTFQTKYQQAMQQVQNGELSPVQQKQKEQELKLEQQSITTFEQDVQKQIMQKREELLTPILNKIDAAIRQVAVSNGYTMIFDTSKGQLLYAVESQDVMEQVKASL